MLSAFAGFLHRLGGAAAPSCPKGAKGREVPSRTGSLCIRWEVRFRCCREVHPKCALAGSAGVARRLQNAQGYA